MTEFDSNDLPRGRITAQVALTSLILISLLAFSEKGYSEPMSWQSYAVVALVYLTATFIIWFPSWGTYRGDWRMTDTEKLRNALVWHDYAARSMIDAVAALLEATDFDAKPDERHKARSVAKRDLQMAYMALEQAQLVQAITDVDE